ncbi:hypothetical protein CAP35_10360 [Chitinophagaceae bacterium IBVUCB1]|nr:hypothetical protein CAP35_10360 [Chitinophagaceae bacterium IBVUCB1]
MEIKLDIPVYDKNSGIKYKWIDGFDIDVVYENEIITISANKEGLLSIANHFLNLAQDSVPNGCHLHFDKYNSLNENSTDLVIQKK